MFGARPGDARVAYALLARVLRGLIERWGAPKEPWIVAELARLLPELGAAPSTKFQALQMQQAVAQTIAAAAKSGVGRPGHRRRAVRRRCVARDPAALDNAAIAVRLCRG